MAKTSKSNKYVYLFGNKKADGNGSMKPLLGGKGANLAEMTRIGLPVPPGFTITTEVCTYYYANKRTYPEGARGAGRDGIAFIEKIMGTKFGDKTAMPLLVSVRSGARDSMPGMMDTILNLGLNDETVARARRPPRRTSASPGTATAASSRCMATSSWACRRREGEDHEPFEVVIHELQAREVSRGHRRHRSSPPPTCRNSSSASRRSIKERTGKEFPQDPWKQLWGAAGAVFGSWMNDRAIVYRRKYNIPSEWGTAVNVQAMVYGNTGDNSGSGVAFTRNPANGTKEFYGEFLINAQGEDVVAGVRTPEPVAQLKKQMPEPTRNSTTSARPWRSISRTCRTSSSRSRTARCSCSRPATASAPPLAALKFSIDMVKEKLIDWKTAILRNPADQLDQLLAPIFDSRRPRRPPRSSPPVCPPAPAPPPARSISTPTAPSRPPRRAKKSCSSASKPRPKTCAA